MIAERFPELSKLSVEEKRRLMNELWTEVSRTELEMVDPSVVELLEQRWRHYESNPETAISLEDFRRRIGVL